MIERTFPVRIIDSTKTAYSEQVQTKQMNEQQLADAIASAGKSLKESFPYDSYRNCGYDVAYAVIFPREDETTDRAEIYVTGKAIRQYEQDELKNAIIHILEIN